MWRQLLASYKIVTFKMANERLSGKVAIITGAGSGFGETFAKRFVREGAKVVVAEINESAGKRVEQELSSAHPDQVIFVQVDVTSRKAWEELLKTTLDKFGRLDIVFNNAGTTYRKKPSHEVTEKEWQMLVDVNMKSIYLSTAVVVPYFMERKSGHSKPLCESQPKGYPLTLFAILSPQYVFDWWISCQGGIGLLRC